MGLGEGRDDIKKKKRERKEIYKQVHHIPIHIQDPLRLLARLGVPAEVAQQGGGADVADGALVGLVADRLARGRGRGEPVPVEVARRHLPRPVPQVRHLEGGADAGRVREVDAQGARPRLPARQLAAHELFYAPAEYGVSYG